MNAAGRSLPELEWPPSFCVLRSPVDRTPSAVMADVLPTTPDNCTSTGVTPRRLARSGRASTSSSRTVDQSYDEFVRLQNVTRFMQVERERGVRTSIQRAEHEKWLTLRRWEREERLAMAEHPARPSSSMMSSQLLDFCQPETLLLPAFPPSENEKTTSAGKSVSAVSRAHPNTIQGALGADNMPDAWRGRFRGIYLKPSPNLCARTDQKPLETRCCTTQ